MHRLAAIIRVMHLTLCYHHVSPWRRLYSVTPEVFDQHLELLRSHGWEILGFDEFTEHSRRASRARTALVTFDDGNADVWLHAAPVLAARGLAATMFVISSDVTDGPARQHGDEEPGPGGSEDEPVRVRWAELSDWMASGGLSVQTHTHQHSDWRREPGAAIDRSARLQADLDESCALIEARLGQRPRALAWPWGRSDPALRAVAARSGMNWQFSVIPGVDLVPAGRTTLWHRVPADGLGPSAFRAMLARYRHRPVARIHSLARRGLAIARAESVRPLFRTGSR